MKETKEEKPFGEQVLPAWEIFKGTVMTLIDYALWNKHEYLEQLRLGRLSKFGKKYRAKKVYHDRYKFLMQFQTNTITLFDKLKPKIKKHKNFYNKLKILEEPNDLSEKKWFELFDVLVEFIEKLGLTKFERTIVPPEKSFEEIQ